jgi:DNA polymerase-4/DNA polymerase V
MHRTAPFTLHSFPRAILHVDGDAFFASVEQAVHPEYRSKPVVTGKERGIIACASYEAKALGIKRGVPLFEAVKSHPELIVLPSDYETYSLYSRRMFQIMRRFTPEVEEYSIDEGFADISGLRRIFRTSYENIARRLQAEIHDELNLTVSVGLSLSKSLAKLASKFRKPAGFTAVRGRHIHLFLQHTPLEKVWGFGPNTVALLHKHGLKTAWDFAVQPETLAENLLGKIGLEIWNELRGNAVYPVNPIEKSTYASISKCKTFTAPSGDENFVYAALIRNLESAFIKLRRYHLRVKTITVILRRQDFSETGLEVDLNRPTAATQEAVPAARVLFENIYERGTVYRATMVILGKLEPDEAAQPELFEDRLRVEKLTRVSKTVDAINSVFGKHTVSLGTSLFLNRWLITARAEKPVRKLELFAGETPRRRLGLPRIFIGV